MILSRIELSAGPNINLKSGFFVVEFEREAPCQNHRASLVLVRNILKLKIGGWTPQLKRDW